MKVSAIQNYEFKNNLIFEGKKDRKNNVQPHSTSPAKAVPIALLIAMSPVNAPLTNANPAASPAPQTEIIQRHHKVLSELAYPNATPSNEPCTVKFVSTNGNDNTIEKVVLVFDNSHRKEQSITTIQADMLKKRYIVTEYGNGSKEVTTEYYAVGPEQLKQNKGSVYNFKLGSHEISKNLYESIKNLMGDEIEYSTEYKNEYFEY